MIEFLALIVAFGVGMVVGVIVRANTVRPIQTEHMPRAVRPRKTEAPPETEQEKRTREILEGIESYDGHKA